MAKKEDLELDDWDLDDELDFDADFEPPSMAPPSGREAVMSIPAKAVTSAASTIAGEGKRRKLILDSLPKDYTVAADAYDNIASEGTAVYREAKDQLRQTKIELKKAGREALPMLKQYLPESLTKRVEKWTKDDSSTGNYAHVDERQAAIDAALSDTFQVKSEEARKEKLKERAEDELKESADILRQNRLHESLAGVHANTDAMVGYQTVTTNYRRKMLEINYRQYYALTDLLDITKSSMEKLVPASESIVRNTALPDYAKEEFLEIGQAMLKRKILSALSPAEFARSYLSQLGTNARRALSDFGSGVRDNISMVGGVVGMMGDDSSEDDSHLSPAQKRLKAAQTGAGMAGGMLARKYIQPHIRKIQEKLREQGEGNEALASFGRRARYNLTNLPEILNTYAKDNNYEGQHGWLGSLAALLQDIMPSYDGDTVGVTDVTGEELERAVPWSRRSDLTLNEVLPGWLSKIHGALTGVDEQYDHTTKQFVSTDVIRNRIRDTVGDQETREYVRQEIDRLVDIIDPDKELSAQDRTVLGRVLDEKIRKVESFDVRDLANSYDAYGSAGYNHDVMDLMTHFGQIEYDKPHQEKLNIEISDELRRLRESITPVQAAVDEMTGLYGHNAVANSGVLDQDLSLNKAMVDSYSNVADIHPASPEARARVAKVVEEVGKVILDPTVEVNIRDVTADVYQGVKDALYQSEPNLYMVLKDAMLAHRPPSTPLASTVVSVAQPKTEEDRDYTAEIYTGVRDALYYSDPNMYSVLSDVLYDRDRPNNLYTVIATACGELAKGNDQSDRGALESVVERIHAQLVANDISPQVDAILDLIEHMAISGIGTYEQPEGEKPGYFGKFGQHLRGTKDKTVDKVVSGYTWGREKLGKGKDWLKSKIGSPFKAIGALKDTVTDTVGSAWRGLTGTRDIYDDQGNVVLSGRILKMGQYFDADGKVIKTLKDIKGAIYDRDGNIVLSAEEVLRNASKYTYYTKQGWRKLSEMVGGGVGSAANRVVSIPKNVARFLKDQGGGVLNSLRTSGDIYVKGEDEPRLKRHLMLKGFYFDKKTGKVIRDVDDIGGPVVTGEGHEVISASELADPNFQLVDVNGEPFKSVVSKAVDKVGSVYRFGKRAVTGAVGFAADLLGAGAEGIRGFFKGFVTTEDVKGIKTVLTDIYELLDERLPGGSEKSEPEEKVAGDADGDGVRDNSFRDIFRRRREARAAAAEKNEVPNRPEDVDKKSPLGKILGALMGVGGFVADKFMGLMGTASTFFVTKVLGGLTDGFGKLAAKFAGWVATAMAGKQAADTVGEVLDTAGDIDLEREGRRRGGRRGRMRDGLRRGGNAAKNAAKRATSKVSEKMAQRAAAKAATQTASRAAAQTAARQAVIQGGRMAATAGVTAAASGISMAGVGSAVASGAAAVGSFLTAPVVLGAIAVGGLGYLAYRIATSEDNGPLDQIRFAQYGLEDYDDAKHDEVAKIRYLEAEVGKYVAYNKDGVASIRGFADETAIQVAAGFGVDVDNAEDLQAYEDWFYGRFCSVYLLWASRLRQLSPSSTMGELEKTVTDAKIRAEMAQRTLLPETHPVFNVMVSPFEPGWFGRDDLLSGTKVRGIHLDLLSDLKKKAEKAKDKVLASAEKDTTVVAIKSPAPTDSGSGSVVTVKKSANPNHDTDNKKSSTASVDEIMLDAASGNFRMGIIELSATEAVRMRAYGLTKLKTSKVLTLMALELDAHEHIVISRGIAKFKGSVEEFAKVHMPEFGSNYDDAEQQTAWRGWFTHRFLPILLKYLSVLNMHAPNARPFDIVESSTTPYLADVAKSLTWARVEIGGENVGVWSVMFNPWNDKDPINTDPKSTQGNIEFLESRKAAAELAEKTIDPNRPTAQVLTAGTNNRPRADSGSGTGPVVTAGSADQQRQQVSSAIDNAWNNRQVGGPGGNSGGPISSSGIPIGDISDPVDPNGAYAKIKLASHSRGDVAKMISEVSKATGMDENLMLTVAMMESSLNPNAGATTSSAKGLYQFLVGKDGKSGTWGEQLRAHANKYGIPSNASAFDPVANALLGAEYLRLGARTVGNLSPSGKATPVDLYLSHFLGPGGARTFLRGLKKHPDKSVLPEWQKQAKANTWVFYAGNRPRSYREVYMELQRRARNAFNSVSQYASVPGQKAIEPPMAPPSSPEAASVASASVSGNVVDTPAPNMGGGAMPSPAADSGLPESSTPEQREAVTVAKAKQDVRQVTAERNQGAVSTIIPSEAPSVGSSIAERTVGAMRKKVGDGPHRVDMERYETAVKDEVMTNTVAPAMNLSEVMASITRQQRAMAEATNGILNEQLLVQREMAATLLSIRDQLLKSSNAPKSPVAPPTVASSQGKVKAEPAVTHQRGVISMAREYF
jgi:soluble lytic murein transglycosylase-like protein